MTTMDQTKYERETGVTGGGFSAAVCRVALYSSRHRKTRITALVCSLLLWCVHAYLLCM